MDFFDPSILYPQHQAFERKREFKVKGNAAYFAVLAASPALTYWFFERPARAAIRRWRLPGEGPGT